MVPLIKAVAVAIIWACLAAQWAAPKETAYIWTVKEGDTIWSIAETMAVKEDPRLVVWRIRAENGLRSDLIHPGQELTIRIFPAN